MEDSTVMIDETVDIANTDQVILVFQWMNSELSVHKEFVHMVQLNLNLTFACFASRVT